jgi:ubiquinone/menaquinone biosynthesis C-methylase UbiE
MEARIPDTLIKALADKRLVPFVGSGVSRSILKNDGEIAFPTWAGLLHQGALALERDQKPELAKVVEASIALLDKPNISATSPIQLFDMISKNLSGQSWAKFLKQQLDPEFDEIDSSSLVLPKTLWKLANNLIITTNFDKVLQWSCKDPWSVRNLQLEDYSGLQQLMSGECDKPTIWYLHGCIDNPSKLILTSDNYSKLYSPSAGDYEAAQIVLKSSFTGKIILFVGFSFSDEYVCNSLDRLVRAFFGFGGEHFALVPEKETSRAEPLLKNLQVTIIPFSDYGQPLIDALNEIVDSAGDAPGAPQRDLKHQITRSPPTSTEDRWLKTTDLRFMDQLGPMYILDKGYYFLDWNTAFERLFAKPFSLFRGQHAQEFIKHFVNRDGVESRTRDIFGRVALPPLDMEKIVINSKEFGTLELWKIAASVYDEKGELAAWSVALNIISADRLGALWDALKDVLDERLNWSRYAGGYDELLLRYPPYNALVSSVCSQLRGKCTCVDIGAGTGNGALELLKQDPDRTIYAIEPYEEMLVHLRNKLASRYQKFENRIRLVKQNATCLSSFADETFDGALMINSLYTIDEPAVALKEVARVLQPNGVLGLSTPHRTTDIGRLFKDIQRHYATKGLLTPKQEQIIDHARERHRNMMKKIQRDTEDDIQKYLLGAGFKIEDWIPNQYVGAVVVAKAVKMG